MSIQFNYIVNPNVPYGDMPENLRPLRELRTLVYSQIGGKATQQEKNWIIRESQGENLDLNGGFRPKVPKGVLLKRYSLSKNFFSKNMKSFLQYGTTFEAHRPDNIRPSEITMVSEILAERRMAQHEPTIDEVVTIFYQIRNMDVESLATEVDIECFQENMCPRTIRSTISKYFLIQTVDYTSNTNARIQATMDPIMTYVWYLVNFACSSMLPSCNKWNFDGTTYIMEPIGNSKKVVRLSKEDEHYAIGSEPPVKYNRQSKRKSGSNLSFAIKLMHLSSAYGEIGPMVAVVAMDGMDPEAFHVERLETFTSSNSSRTPGVLYFTKTRAGNAAMWRHYMLNVLIPCLVSSGNAKRTSDQGFFLSSDSEDIVISQCFNAEVRQAFQDSSINYARIGASLTSIHQAADRQRTFLASKRFVKDIRVTDNINRLVQDIDLDFFTAAFVSFKHAFPDVSLPDAQIEKLVSGLITIKLSFCEVVTTQMIQKGFECCGQHTNPKVPTDPSISFETMMRQCKRVISIEQLQLMKALAPELSGIILDKGTVTLEDLTSRGIEVVDGVTKDRPLFSHIHHWAEVVTNDTVANSYNEEQRAKSAEAIEENRAIAVLQSAKSRAERQQKKASDKEIQEAQKLLEKEAEKERWASLTKAQQLQEQAEKKTQREAAKRKREEDQKAKQEQDREKKRKAIELLSANGKLPPEYIVDGNIAQV